MQGLGSLLTLLLLFPLSSSGDVVFQTLAGSTKGGGHRDGIGSEARFSAPSGIATCEGTIFVADMGNHAIRRVDASGAVTTWAGRMTVAGSSDGPRLDARFRRPAGLDGDAGCNVFVADAENQTIRRIGAAGAVTTVAGSAGVEGNTDGAGQSARFRTPTGVTVDRDGNVFVADSGNHTIRKIDTGGNVTTLAGRAGAAGLVNGSASIARFNNPRQIAFASDGTLLVADFGNSAIRRVNMSGVVTTVATNAGYPSDLVERDGAIFTADLFDSVIRRISATGEVSIIAGAAAQFLHVDGSLSEARFESPAGIAIDGADLVVVEESGNTVRRVRDVVSTIAGSVSEAGTVDGVGTEARFTGPSNVHVAVDGTVFVAENSRIRRIDRDGHTSTLAGLAGTPGAVDGKGDRARFNGPRGMALDANGNLFVSETGSHTIRKITADGTVTTIAGKAGQSGNTNGPALSARFNGAYNVAVDQSGNLFVADPLNHAVRKISNDGVVTSIGTDLNTPVDILVDDQQRPVVWDENRGELIRIESSGTMTVLGKFHGGSAYGIARTSDGNYYLADTIRHTILRLVSDGTFEVIGGEDRSPGNENGPGEAARFNFPLGIDAGPDGALYVADTRNHAIRVAHFGALPAIASFVVSPSAFKAGQTVTLSWTVSGATTITIDPSIGPVNATGSVDVKPVGSTRYVLRATNSLGTVEATAYASQIGVRSRAVRH